VEVNMTLSLILRPACFGLALAALSLTAAQAAPPALVSATPDAKTGWEAFPKQLKLTFNEPIAATGDQVQLMGPDGRRIQLGTPVVSKDGLTVTATPATNPPVEGPYAVRWQATSTSGEQGKGEFSIFVN
jgi:methionine-rich copper-binding protein CopC